VALTCVFFAPRLDLGPAQVAAFVPALGLAVVMRFSLEWALAMAAFWTTRITAINQSYFTAVLFLSGRLAPLELLPAPVQVLATVLPFRWMISFPIEVLLGKTAGMQIVWGLAAQLAWLAVGVAAGRLLWRAGLRQFSAVGS
jgi:ABC-2 type transport system permease protein